MEVLLPLLVESRVVLGASSVDYSYGHICTYMLFLQTVPSHVLAVRVRVRCMAMNYEPLVQQVASADVETRSDKCLRSPIVASQSYCT